MGGVIHILHILRSRYDAWLDVAENCCMSSKTESSWVIIVSERCECNLIKFSIDLLQSIYTSAWGAHWWWLIDCIQNRSHTPFCWIVVVIPFEIWKLGEFYWAVSLHQWPNYYGCWLVQAAIICQKVSHWSFPFFLKAVLAIYHSVQIIWSDNTTFSAFISTRTLREIAGYNLCWCGVVQTSTIPLVHQQSYWLKVQL